jgi:hypothetical protein
MERELFLGEERCCFDCQRSACIYRCRNCHGGLRMSKECLRKAHSLLPTHQIEVSTRMHAT